MVATPFLATVLYSLLRIFSDQPSSSSQDVGQLVPDNDIECYHDNGARMRGPPINQRYFDLFSPTRPSNSRRISPQADIYRCWDQKYYSYFASITSKVRKTQMFASFHPVTQEAVSELQQLIEDNISKNTAKVVTFLEYLKQRRDIHPQLLMHAIAGAEISSKSPILAYLPTPALPEIFPTKFFSGSFDTDIVTKRGMVGSSTNGECVLVNEKWGKTNGIENRLWFWREDVALNMHHWTWHLHNPTNSQNPIPRRGELFYFFHHDLLARYASERIASGFDDYFVVPVHPREGLVIGQGYDSNLKDGVSSMEWINRPNKTIMSVHDLPPDLASDFPQHQIYWDRVANITNNKGYAKTDNGETFLPPDATNPIAELFEGSKWGLNHPYYGPIGWHNEAHNLIGSLLVNKNQTEKQVGVLADVSTAVRDMVFYRIHQSVNEMFMNYKHAIMTPYEFTRGDHPLILPGIVGRSISTQTYDIKNPGSSGCNLNETFTGRNRLGTCWKPRNMILDGGLDFDYNGKHPDLKLHVCLKHLDHGEFNYEIAFENQLPTEQQVYVRIFMAPRYKNNGQRFSLEEQYPLFFVQDGFPTTLKPGLNNFTRKSVDSSVTAPWWKTKSELQAQLSDTTLTGEPGECTCGFPHHLLIPVGADNGSVYDLVAMITDGKDYDLPAGAKCTSSWIHCGLPGNDYPDKKPMGYPWDRAITPGFGGSGKMLEDYVSQIPNMVMTTISVYHDDTEVKEHVGGYNPQIMNGTGWREEVN